MVEGTVSGYMQASVTNSVGKIKFDHKGLEGTAAI